MTPKLKPTEVPGLRLAVRPPPQPPEAQWQGSPQRPRSTSSLMGLGGGDRAHLPHPPKGPVPLTSGRELTAVWAIYKMRTTYRNHRELTVHSSFIYIYI